LPQNFYFSSAYGIRYMAKLAVACATQTLLCSSRLSAAASSLHREHFEWSFWQNCVSSKFC